MTEPFITHLKKYIDISDADIPVMLSFFKTINVQKKENLIRTGDVCKWNYFVLKGCLRMFFVDDKGVEQTTHFAIESWWLTDNLAFKSQQPSDFYIQAVEHSEVLAIDIASLEKLSLQFPQIEKYFRIVYQKAYGASQLRVKYMYSYSKEEMYRFFIGLFPEFVQRIPQYLLASYLGFTPEYLSEIRKKYLS